MNRYDLFGEGCAVFQDPFENHLLENRAFARPKLQKRQRTSLETGIFPVL